MPDDQQSKPSWKRRILAASYYCGAAPVLGHFPSRRQDPYAEHHYKQALSVYFVLLAVLFLYVLFSLFLSGVLVFRREWYENTTLEPTMLMIVRRAFLCWLVVWAFGTVWALQGSWATIPLVGRLARWNPLMLLSLAGYTLLLVTGILVASATLHASTLTRSEGRPAKAYMLYDDMGLFPHWVFDLGFYPIARAATDRWGDDTVVVAPLSKEGLAKALAEGSFVFILSHGTEEGLYTSEFRINPGDAAPQGIGEDLRFVYITGCDSGALAQEWERSLAPAEVVTFDRLSAWLEHIYWLLFRGADQIRALD